MLPPPAFSALLAIIFKSLPINQGKVLDAER